VPPDDGRVPTRLAIALGDPSSEDVGFLEDRLYEFNAEATGIRDGEGLGAFVRDEHGAILAAAAGHTWGGTAELKQVWVHPRLRGRGLGRELVAAAEAEARRRGCVQLVLSTHAFQAPGFYRKLGYETVAEMPEYPRGHSQIWMRKRLV
jgi:ribosomal protein S18 acetylase RimI-like enzyme